MCTSKTVRTSLDGEGSLLFGKQRIAPVASAVLNTALGAIWTGLLQAGGSDKITAYLLQSSEVVTSGVTASGSGQAASEHRHSFTPRNLGKTVALKLVP
jgi:hypothetical protein